MRPLIAITGILLFAAVTALLVLWGMRRAYFQQERLTNMLLSKSAERVMHYLKSHDTITEKEIRSLVDGVQASEFMSRKRAVVQGNQEFAGRLVQVMLQEQKIEPVNPGSSVYRRKGKWDQNI